MLKKNGDSKTSLSIESSEATNALVITGPNGIISNLKGIIAKLDIQRAQVMIEAVIVQITGDVDDDFGLIWGILYFWSFSTLTTRAVFKSNVYYQISPRKDRQQSDKRFSIVLIEV